MNKRIIGLILAGLICVAGEVTASYANENLNEAVQVKTEQTRTKNGWVKDEHGNWTYYKNGERLENQWIKENGKWYYVNRWGYMANGGSEYIDGKFYIFDNNGAMIEKKGWVELKNVNIDSSWFYGNGDGTVKTDYWLKENGKWYYFNEAGYMITWTYGIDGKCYAFDKSGAMIEKKGWVKFDDYTWFYGNGDGTVKSGQWLKENGKWYYFNGNGEMSNEGSYYIDDKCYIFDKSGGMIEKKGWIFDSGYSLWYYGNGDGTVKTEEWIKENGKWYYIGYWGHMIKDESLDINGKEYVFDSNGVCVNPY